MTTPSTPQGNMLRAHADIEDYRSRGDFTAQYLRDAAGIIDAQAEEISSLRAERERCIGPLVPKDQLDKSKARVAELEGRLREATSLLRDLLEVEGAESYGEYRASIMAVLAKLSAE